MNFLIAQNDQSLPELTEMGVATNCPEYGTIEFGHDRCAVTYADGGVVWIYDETSGKLSSFCAIKKFINFFQYEN
jgi:hypothetical protein